MPGSGVSLGAGTALGGALDSSALVTPWLSVLGWHAASSTPASTGASRRRTKWFMPESSNRVVSPQTAKPLAKKQC
jgi:hypothetical protein